MLLEGKRVNFQPISGYWFTSYLIDSLRRVEGCVELSLDIGLARTTICVNEGYISFDGFRLKLTDVTPSENDRIVLVEDQGKIYEVALHTEKGFYKLKAVGEDKAPTLEINGIHMHRIVGTDPWKDSMSKVVAAKVKRGNVVLDTCTGLGYTAILSCMRGASLVYTFEVDENVVWIAERNPWSRGLSSGGVNIFLADITRAVYDLPAEFFHRVIHDPPRFSSTTGDLYGLDFYRELYRVLKEKGVLFHYTGEPRRHGPHSVLKGIKERLERAGFKVLKFDERAQGYVAIKI